MADPTQIHQILMNLCANAAHAMGQKGGVLEIALSEVEIDSRHDREFAGIAPGPCLRLSVSDTGCGIAEDLQQQIFEPYFTTKAPDEGTGLGLAVVYGIVKNIGGAITFSSTPGRGTTFHIVLPKAPSTADTVPDPGPGSTSEGSGHILLVDDEEAVANLQQEILEWAGYTVEVRYGSVEALEDFRANPESFDLVLTDQTMPGMTGLELSQEIRKIRPDIPIVLCSGFSPVIDDDRAGLSGINAFLMKPMLKQELVDAVEKILREKTGRIRVPAKTSRQDRRYSQ